ncbi:MAG: phospholipase D-like domain-containing protein [Candidatus Scalindua sp.]|nr:phospholipase D-like domain-containing protein [Candidatus Scalindua sp.]
MLYICESIRFAPEIAARLSSLGKCLCIVICFAGTLSAKTEVFFSPDGFIRDNIIKVINASEKSIDIALLTFSAGEIAEALYEARERGVEVRIILDYKQKNKYQPVVEFLQDEGFPVQFLKGKIGGDMNNSFALFDSGIVVTGSYRWSEYSEKFNYENALFIDDPDVIKKFQEEFDSLYGKCLVKKEQRQEDAESLGAKADTINRAAREAGLSAINLPENIRSEEPAAGMKGILTDGSPLIPFQGEIPRKDGLTDGKREEVAVLDISFQEFDNLFGRRGSLGRSERKRVWNDRFEGKYVKWTGEIGYKGIAVYDWNKIGIRHKDNSIDVQLRVDWTKKQKMMNLVMGDVITYSGRLVSPGGFMAPYKLDDVDILDVQ